MWFDDVTKFWVHQENFRHWKVHPDAIRMPIFVPIIFCLISFSLVISKYSDSISILFQVAVSTIKNFHNTSTCLGILVGGFIFFMIFVYDKALPTYKPYRKVRHCFNGKVWPSYYLSFFPLDISTRWFQIIFNVMPEIHGMKNHDHAIRKISAISIRKLSGKVWLVVLFVKVKEEIFHISGISKKRFDKRPYWEQVGYSNCLTSQKLQFIGYRIIFEPLQQNYVLFIIRIYQNIVLCL